MLQPQPHFFAVEKDELVQVVQYEFERLRIAFVNFNDLAYAAGIEGFVFDASEVAEDLLNFLLHALSYYLNAEVEYLNGKPKLPVLIIYKIDLYLSHFFTKCAYFR